MTQKMETVLRKNTPGHDEHGIRVFAYPDDPPGRFLKDSLTAWHRSGCKIQITGFNPHGEHEELWECPECHAVSQPDHFDCLGADNGDVFCFNCGAVICPIDLWIEFNVCPD